MKIPFIKLSILFILPFSVLVALEDTKENRIIQAERYLKQFSLVDMIGGTWEQMFKHPPFLSWSDKQKKVFSDRMTAIVTSEEYDKILMDGMLETFTADELKAFADFYDSEHGKSAMKKMNNLMTNMMPRLQLMMQKEIPLLLQEITNSTK
jgi:hypothetical protein